MASFRAEGDASRFRSASVENASLALRKAFSHEIHRLRLADIPWSLAAPGPHRKHIASNRLRDICVPRLLEFFRKSSHVSDLIRPFWRMSSNGPQVRNCIASSLRGAAHTACRWRQLDISRRSAHACKLDCDGRIPMIGMLLHPSSPLTTLCGRQPQAAACPFPTWTSPAPRIAGFSSTATPQPPARAR
jgi:hypothetical protein